MSEAQLKEQFLALRAKNQANPEYADVIRYLDKCLLIQSIKVGDIDIDRFEKFLEHPFTQRLNAYFHGEQQKLAASRPFVAINRTWNLFPWYERGFNDANLVAKGKELVCVSQENVERFSKYFRERELLGLLIAH
jgi:hypothetical protein